MADQSNGGQDRPNGRKANGSNPTSFGNRDKEVQEEEASGSNQPSLGNRDLEKIVSSVNKELRQKSPLPAVACIFRVPEMLRRANDNKIFEPELVSIGPFHHEKSQLQKKEELVSFGPFYHEKSQLQKKEELVSFGPFHPPLHHEKPQLQKMEEIKYWYLQRLLDRKPTPATTLECFVQAIGEIEQECRACYAEEIPFDKEEFVKMMVVDGCFIIEFFRYLRRSLRFKRVDEDDPVFNTSWMFPQILTELLLLENQLPWRVLTLLFEKAYGSNGSLATLAAISFSVIAPSRNLHPIDNLQNENSHLLDFLRNCLIGSYEPKKDIEQASPSSKEDIEALPSSKEDIEQASPWIDHIPSVTELRQAGVKFRIKEKQDLRSRWQRLFSCFGVDAGSPEKVPLLDRHAVAESQDVKAEMLDITFKHGVMEIPPIFVCENTETLLRNLVAFEHCDKDGKNKITSYIVLWDNLINSSKDVDFLVQEKIVRVINCLSTEHAGTVFNRLADNSGFNNFLYKDLYTKVNKWRREPWNRWRELLISDYFNNPWAYVSFFVAIVILTLTFLQTIYTMLSY